MKRTPLRRTSALRRSEQRRTWRRAESDKVTPDLHGYILARDGQCVAATLDAPYPCRDEWGEPLDPRHLYALELDHVRDQPMMGKRAPSDKFHLVAMCPGHHRLDGWATANRPALRAYLSRVEGRAA